MTRLPVNTRVICTKGKFVGREGDVIPGDDGEEEHDYYTIKWRPFHGKDVIVTRNVGAEYIQAIGEEHIGGGLSAKPLSAPTAPAPPQSAPPRGPSQTPHQAQPKPLRAPSSVSRKSTPGEVRGAKETTRVHAAPPAVPTLNAGLTRNVDFEDPDGITRAMEELDADVVAPE